MNDRELLQRLDAALDSDLDAMPDHVFEAVISALPGVRRRSDRGTVFSVLAVGLGGAAIAATVMLGMFVSGVLRPPEVGPPGPSVEGDQFVIVTRSATTGADLGLASVSTGEVATLTSMPGDEVEPAWAPDGTAVAFVNSGDLYTVNVETGAATQLTATPDRSESSPAYSPAGDTIAFTAAIGARMTLWTMPSAGGEPRLMIEFDAPFACCPSWAPDGSKLAVALDRTSGGGLDLYLVDVASGTQTQLTETSGDDASHAWSPDGELIAFQADQESGLVVMRPDGAERRRLTTVGDEGFGISWSPDSTRIAFVRRGVIRVIGRDRSGEADLLNIAGTVIEDIAWRP